MLNDLKLTQPFASNSLPHALAALAQRRTVTAMMPIEVLRVMPDGRLLLDSLALSELPSRGVPMTADAASHIDQLVGISARYAAKIDAELHADSINRLVSRQRGFVHVIISMRADGDDAHVEAVTKGAHLLVPPARVLQRLVDAGVEGHVSIEQGLTTVRFGISTTEVEVLPGDVIATKGELALRSWGPRHEQPSFESSVFTLRLVCTNGAVAMSRRTHLKAMTVSETMRLVDGQIARVKAFEAAQLRLGVERLASALPTDDELSKATAVLERAVGAELARTLIDGVTSRFDLLNAYTGAAHHASGGRVRELQVIGGSMLDQAMLS